MRTLELTGTQLKALEKCLDYLLENEANHYSECLECGLDVGNHIYHYVVTASQAVFSDEVTA